MASTLRVRADEVRTGDVAAVRGIVGTVTSAVHYGGNAPRSDITIRTDWGTDARDVFASHSPMWVERAI